MAESALTGKGRGYVVARGGLFFNRWGPMRRDGSHLPIFSRAPWVFPTRAAAVQVQKRLRGTLRRAP